MCVLKNLNKLVLYNLDFFLSLKTIITYKEIKTTNNIMQRYICTLKNFNLLCFRYKKIKKSYNLNINLNIFEI